eukprot:Opistho-1_new@70310
MASVARKMRVSIKAAGASDEDLDKEVDPEEEAERLRKLKEYEDAKGRMKQRLKDGPGVDLSGRDERVKESASDMLGFCFNDTTYKADEHKKFMQSYNATLTRRAMRWDKMLRTPSQWNRSNRVFKRFCRKGVPASLRGQVWMAVTGAQAEMEANAGVFAKLIAEAECSAAKFVDDIERGKRVVRGGMTASKLKEQFCRPPPHVP